MSAARAHEPAARLERGLVAATHRRHFAVLLPGGERVDCVQKGRALALAVGDQVDVRRVAGGGAIEAVAPRRNLVWRSDAFKEKLLAANVTQIAAVVAPDLSLDEELLNRWMIAAESTACRFVIVANKADLPSFAALRARLAPFAALGYPVVELAAKRDPAPALYPLPAAGGDAWIVDSPGMKAFGLAHLDPEVLAHAFVELRPYLGRCRFRDCRHDREPGCAVAAAVAAGKVAPHRLALLHALLREARGSDP